MDITANIIIALLYIEVDTFCGSVRGTVAVDEGDPVGINDVGPTVVGGVEGLNELGPRVVGAFVEGQIVGSLVGFDTGNTDGNGVLGLKVLGTDVLGRDDVGVRVVGMAVGGLLEGAIDKLG